MRRKRGIVVKLLVCVLAGAVVTWAVAWGCALWGPQASAAHGQGLEYRPSLFELPTEWEGRYTGGGRSDSWARSSEICVGDEWGTRGVSCEDCGWPARAMRSLSIWSCDATAGVHQVVSDYLDAPELFAASGKSTLVVMVAGQFTPKPNSLPTRILPLGFIVNTLLVAGALFGAIQFAEFARRRRRAQRGRCLDCGYDRRGLAEGVGCPECGAGGGGA